LYIPRKAENLENGKKYVGITSNPKKRLTDHFNGNGAQWTQKHQPKSVNSINQCKSLESAKNAERIMYYNMKNYHGRDQVRGAGNTKSY
jgi:predicted GIY-YIG superfamily endonuclease